MGDVIFVDMLEVDDTYIEETLSEGLTGEQVEYLKANREELNEGIKQTIMEEYFLKAAKLEVEYQLREAGLMK